MKNYFKILLILLTVVFASCETEEFATHSKERVSKSQKISFEDFKQQTGIKDFDTIINIRGNVNSLQARNADGSYELSDFDIDTGIINSIESLNKTSYTFNANPLNYEGTNLFNLIFYKKNNVWEKTIVEMKPTQENLIEIRNGTSDKFEGEVRQIYNSEPPTVVVQNCITITLVQQDCHGCTGVCDGCWQQCVSIIFYTVCSGGGGSAGSNGGPPSGPPSGPTGGNYSNPIDPTNNVIDPNGIVFEPIIESPIPILDIEDAQAFNLFMNYLRITDLTAYNYLLSNPRIKNHLLSYLALNDFSEESKTFIRQFITQCILNPTINLNFNASSKSPMNIDFSSINIETPEGQKFNTVYEALQTSPEFKTLFIDLFQNNNRFNVEFKIGQLNSGTNGNTSVIIGGFPISNTITINPAFLNSANKMEIAKTILHECIHAFLNVKLYDTVQGINVSTLNSEQLFHLINQQYNGFSGSQDQHNFIYNYILPTMEQILSDVKDTLVTSLNNIEMLNDVSVHIPLDSSPSSAFVWNDYYHNLSLNGLQNCSFFQNEIGIVQVLNGIVTPLITIDQTLM